MTALENIYAEIADIGPTFGPAILQRTRALYRPLVEQQQWMMRSRLPDLVYGKDARHRLDVYPGDTPGAPTLLFVHGGGFVGGDKSGDPPFYANVGWYFAMHGFCTVVMNYRLAHTHGWPAGAQDVSTVLSWIADHIADHGGDPSRIVLLGQSAGASHVATCLFDPHIEVVERHRIAGCALMSGFYNAHPPLADGPRLYFGDDEALWPERSPLAHVMTGHPPVILSVAQLDPAEIAVQTIDLARALTVADGSAPQMLYFKGHNHVSPIHGLGLGDDLAGIALRGFFANVLANA